MNIRDHFNTLENVIYNFNDRYGLSYITQKRYDVVLNSLSYLRKYKEINHEEYHTLVRIFKHQRDNLTKIKNLEAKEPRTVAQAFIGKKHIRKWLFKRDNYKCLKCGSSDNLTVDHIIPIHYGGENKLSNLQTLCRSCNSWKSTKIIDYR